MKDDSNDERDRLLQRFLKEIQRVGENADGNGQRTGDDDPQGSSDLPFGSAEFFSEEDLVDLFDYANDLDNAFVRSEVLIYGARLYPDSDDLLVRRAYHYYYAGMDSIYIMDVLRRMRRPDLLSSILMMRLTCTDSGACLTTPVETTLQRLLASVRTFSDEELIQFIDAAADCGASAWLISHLDDIKAKCEYLPTLFFELGEILAEAGDHAGAVTMFDELTKIEPFNLSFWNRLTELAIAARDYERAAQSSDFASAIDPDDNTSRVLHAQVDLATGRDADKICSTLRPVAMKMLRDDGNALAVEVLAGALDSVERDRSAAQALLAEALDEAPHNRELLDMYAQTNAPDVAARFEALLAANPDVTTREVLEWVESISEREPRWSPSAMEQVYSVLFNADKPESLLIPGVERLLEAAYVNRHYYKVSVLADAIDAQRAACEPAAPVRADARLALIPVFALLRRSPLTEKTRSEARARIETYLGTAQPPGSLADRLVHEQVTCRLMMLLEPLKKGKSDRSIMQTLNLVDPYTPGNEG